MSAKVFFIIFQVIHEVFSGEINHYLTVVLQSSKY